MNEIENLVKKEARNISEFLDSLGSNNQFISIIAIPGIPVEDVDALINLTGGMTRLDLSQPLQDQFRLSDITNFHVRLVGVPSDPDNVLGEMLTAGHSMMADQSGIHVSFMVDDYMAGRIPRLMSRLGIPTYLLKSIKIGTVDKEVFREWLNDQLPKPVSPEMLEMLIYGTGHDYMAARELVSALFGATRAGSFLINTDGQRRYNCKYEPSLNSLRDENNIPVRIPDPLFLFDTSAIPEPSLGGFLRHVENPRMILSDDVRGEIQGVEEKKKHEGDWRAVNLIRRNLALLNKKVKVVPAMPLSSSASDPCVDARLMRIAEANGAILVTADSTLYLNCALCRVGVVRLVK